MNTEITSPAPPTVTTNSILSPWPFIVLLTCIETVSTILLYNKLETFATDRIVTLVFGCLMLNMSGIISLLYFYSEKRFNPNEIGLVEDTIAVCISGCFWTAGMIGFTKILRLETLKSLNLSTNPCMILLTVMSITPILLTAVFLVLLKYKNRK